MTENLGKEIINRLRQTQFQSNHHSDFEVAIKDAFKFLGFKAEHIGGPNNTDVIAEALIGKEGYILTIDGKTTDPSLSSTTGRIPDSYINWPSVEKHRKMHQADKIIIVGSDFPNSGDIIDNANTYNAILLKTEELISLIEAHLKYPLTLKELKRPFLGTVFINDLIDEVIGNSERRIEKINNLKIVMKEMQYLQSTPRKYFSKEGLGFRQEIIQNEIDDEELDDILQLLSLPFINVIENFPNEPDKYIIKMYSKDIANTFMQISKLLFSIDSETPEIPEIIEEGTPERIQGYNFFESFIRGHSLVTMARRENPYRWASPYEDIKAILLKIYQHFEQNTTVTQNEIISALEGIEYVRGKTFAGSASEGYKIKMALGILELNDLIRWTRSIRPVSFVLNCNLEELGTWITLFPNNMERRD